MNLTDKNTPWYLYVTMLEECLISSKDNIKHLREKSLSYSFKTTLTKSLIEVRFTPDCLNHLRFGSHWEKVNFFAWKQRGKIIYCPIDSYMKVVLKLVGRNLRFINNNSELYLGVVGKTAFCDLI